MEDQDRILAKRVYDVVAVVTEDIDAVVVAVEDGIAYIDGAVPTQAERDAIMSAVGKIDGLTHVIACLAVEHTLPRSQVNPGRANVPPAVLMHYYSLS